MSSTSTLPLVMVFGASGMTGTSIVQGLLRSNKFRVAAITRSTSKPIITEFKSQGVTIHELDLSTATFDQLKGILTGVDVLISNTSITSIEEQAKLFDAAKAAGVKRAIPSDFGPSAPPGVMFFNDKKLAIREYIRQIQQPFTFIEIGFWKQLLLPFPANKAGSLVVDVSFNFYENGDVATAGTDLDHVGDHVARIIQDERTLNQTVFVWEAEITQTEIWKLAEKYCEDWPALEKKRVKISAEEIKRQINEGIATNNIMQRLTFEYPNSLYLRGDNTVKNAISRGALDYKQLYPDVQAQSFEEFAKKFYQNPPALYEA